MEPEDTPVSSPQGNPNTVKRIALVASMAALGNVLAFVSTAVAPIAPQVALDLSHVATFIVAMYCGPYYGLVTGTLVGVAPYYQFGVLGAYGPFLGLLILPGKGLTGLFMGFLARRLRPFPSVILSFIPECIYIYVFTKYVTLIVLNFSLPDPVVFAILTKAWLEIAIMAFLMEIIKKRKIMESIFVR